MSAIKALGQESQHFDLMSIFSNSSLAPVVVVAGSQQQTCTADAVPALMATSTAFFLLPFAFSSLPSELSQATTAQ